MQSSDMDSFITRQKYKEPEFNADSRNLQLIINWLNSTELSPAMLRNIAQLIKFYGVPFLYELKTIYDQFTPALIKACQKERHLITLLAKDFLGKDVPPELEFLMGGDVTKEKINITPHKVTENEKKFTDYLRKVRTTVTRILSIPRGRVQKLQEEVDNFFEMELRPDTNFNLFEDRALDVYIKKVYEHYSSPEGQSNRPPTSTSESYKPPPLQPEPDIPAVHKPYVPPAAQTQKVPLCCRKFFYKDEVLQQSESMTLEFKNYSHPWPPALAHTLKKTICGFLNRNGGILLIGVNEDVETKKPMVNGRRFYNQAVKEQIHVDLMTLAKTIYPNIISNLKLNIQFVPIKSHTTMQFIPGAYLIRVIVEYGNRDSVYFFTENEIDYYYFRTQKQVLRQRTVDVWEEFKNRLKNPLEVPPKRHEGNCIQPDLGKPIYDDPKGSHGRQFDLRDKKDKPEREREEVHEKINSAPIVPGMKAKPAGMVDLSMQVVINLPHDDKNPRFFINKIIQNIKNIDVVSYKQQPDMAGFKLRKQEQPILANNIKNLKKAYPDAERVFILDPYLSLEFRDDEPGQKILRGAADHLAKLNQIQFAMDKQNGVLRFAKVDFSVKAFFALVIKGFKPRFIQK